MLTPGLAAEGVVITRPALYRWNWCVKLMCFNISDPDSSLICVFMIIKQPIINFKNQLNSTKYFRFHYWPYEMVSFASALPFNQNCCLSCFDNLPVETQYFPFLAKKCDFEYIRLHQNLFRPDYYVFMLSVNEIYYFFVCLNCFSYFQSYLKVIPLIVLQFLYLTSTTFKLNFEY